MKVRVKQSQAFSRPPLCSNIRLLHARATPLNQDNQHDNKKHTGNNPDDRGLIHFDSLPSFEWLRTLVSEKRFE
jgi:hypothetical protein